MPTKEAAKPAQAAQPDALYGASNMANIMAATCRAALNQLESFKGAIRTLPASELIPWVDGQKAHVERVMATITTGAAQRTPATRRKAKTGTRGRGRPKGSASKPASDSLAA